MYLLAKSTVQASESTVLDSRTPKPWEVEAIIGHVVGGDHSAIDLTSKVSHPLVLRVKRIPCHALRYQGVGVEGCEWEGYCGRN